MKHYVYVASLLYKCVFNSLHAEMVCSLPFINMEINVTALTNSADIQVIYRGSTPTLSENWRLFAPRVEEKASHLAALGQIHDHARTSTAPFLPLMRST